MRTSLLKKTLFTLILMGAAGNASAEWVLNNAESSINFVSIKKSNVSETHTFENLSGSLKKSGHAKIIIALSSVETMIPIRNDRMKTMLFEVDQFPESSVSTTIDYHRINAMKPGETFSQPLQFKLSLHGEEKLIDADARVVMLAGNKLLVSTVKPIMINATDFSLGKGVEALRKIAKLPSISDAVPVTASLVFKR